MVGDVREHPQVHSLKRQTSEVWSAPLVMMTHSGPFGSSMVNRDSARAAMVWSSRVCAPVRDCIAESVCCSWMRRGPKLPARMLSTARPLPGGGDGFCIALKLDWWPNRLLLPPSVWFAADDLRPMISVLGVVRYVPYRVQK